MADHPIHNPKDYSEVLRQLLTTDPVHADTLNPLFERLLNNDAFIKAAADKIAADLTAHIAAADPHPGYLLESGGTLTGSIAFQDLLEGIILAAGGKIVDQGTGTVINAAEGSLTVTDETGATSLLSLSSTVFKYLNNVIHHAGNHNSTGDPHSQYLKADGTRALTGNLSMGDNILTNVKDIRFTAGTKLAETAGQRTALNAESNRFDVITEDAARYILQVNENTGTAAFMRFDLMGACKIVRSGKDANGKFTQVDYYRTDSATLFQRTILSGAPDANGNYPTMTIKRFADNGITEIYSVAFPITYDADGDYVSIG
ncbi:hypothetical protein RI662_10795 [Brevibacillus agri]|uniref:hypothetical protein n=1 Tax=Brevibacillus agri TaxID=51101 RepID=UPI0028704E9A|nr:hypothetical protein [Brevibacillus agri]MDR9504778.1 hypothetical protein [Brevibacillus agri]